jgi:cell division protein FtsQ
MDARTTDPRTTVRRASRDLAGRWPRTDGGAAPRRTREERRAAWRTTVALVERVVRFVALWALLCAIASLAGSSAFDIQSVGVAGNDTLAASDVIAASGIERQMSVFAVNAMRVRERLRRDPRIADASVHIVFPDRVLLGVEERPPVAALQVPGGYVLVSADGVALATARSARGLVVFTVDGLDAAAVRPGAPLPSPDARLGAGLAASLPPALRPGVEALRVDRAGEVILYTRDGVAVKAGGGDAVRDRIARAGDVLAAVRARGLRVEYIDLRFPDSIIVKPVRTPAAATKPRKGFARPAHPAGELSPALNERPD